MPIQFKPWRLCALIFMLLACVAPVCLAQEIKPVTPAAVATAAKIDTGDTAWLLCSTALVLLMTPGLACFYGGLVRRKNVLGTMMQSMAAMACVGVLWTVIGYTLAFGPDCGHVIGNLKYLFLRGVDGNPHPVYANTTPHLAFMAYQGMFAIITPALIGGAVAERMKFSTFFWFIAIWSVVVYAPAGPLGLGRRRLAGQVGRARFRRRHGRPHQLRFFGLGGLPDAGTAARLPA